jgi:hypothetical protein
VTLDVLQIAASLAPGDLAVLQAHADEIAAEEIREASARHVGPALLYYLEHTAILHLLVCGLLMRHVEQVEAEAAPVVVRSGRWRRLRAPLRRWHGQLRTLWFAGKDPRARLKVRCRCRCGVVFEPIASDVRREKTTSCGCRRDEMTADRNRERAEMRSTA